MAGAQGHRRQRHGTPLVPASTLASLTAVAAAAAVTVAAALAATAAATAVGSTTARDALAAGTDAVEGADASEAVSHLWGLTTDDGESLDLNRTSLRVDADGSMAAASDSAAAIRDVMEMPVMVKRGRLFTAATDLRGSPSRAASTFFFPALLDLSFRAIAFIYYPVVSTSGESGNFYRFSLVDGVSYDIRVGESGGGDAPFATFEMVRASGAAVSTLAQFAAGLSFRVAAVASPAGGDTTRLTVTGSAGASVDDADVTFTRGIVETIKENHERFYTPARCSSSFRTASGTCNNLGRVEAGSRMIALTRLPINDPAFDDGVSSPAGGRRPSARHISNIMGSQEGEFPSARRLADTIWVWGQFLDHDLDLTPAVADGPRAEDLPIPVAGDPIFLRRSSLNFHRSRYMRTGTRCCGNLLSDARPRKFPNKVSAWIDASQVYGDEPVRAAQLRSFVGGRLKTSAGSNLPFNGRGQGGIGDDVPTDAEGVVPGSRLFVAGDVRVNENVLLSASHTLGLREHNRWADAVAAAFPEYDEERVYQTARRIVGLAFQKITYEEWLPALLGGTSTTFTDNTGYDSSADPAVTAFFSSAALRIGHTMVSDSLARRGPGGSVLAPLRLANSFFNVESFFSNEMDSLLRGAASQTAQETDVFIVDGLRNLLFGNPESGSGMDLLSLNIQRGRDHGLPPYNDVRAGLGLPRYSSFMQITDDALTARRLAMAYEGNINAVDSFVGGIAEKHVPGGSVGSLFAAAIRDQFRRLAIADRFFYTRGGPAMDGTLTARLPELADLRPGGPYTFHTLITRNTGISPSELPSRPFFADVSGGGVVPKPMEMPAFDAMRQKAATTLMANAKDVAQDVGLSVGVAL
ncbi:hypothetical protein MMPV_006471 [Pyropia vietnamensis]